WTVMIMGRFAGDKLVEDWVEYDRYNLFRQLGAVWGGHRLRVTGSRPRITHVGLASILCRCRHARTCCGHPTIIAMPLPNRAIGDIATWKWLGDALWASGDHGGAIGIYRQAIDRQPSMAAPYRWLDSALTSLGRLVEAEEVYKRLSSGRTSSHLGNGSPNCTSDMAASRKLSIYFVKPKQGFPIISPRGAGWRMPCESGVALRRSCSTGTRQKNFPSNAF